MQNQASCILMCLWPCAHSFSFILTLQIISAKSFTKEYTSDGCSVLYTGTICQDKINNRLDWNSHDDILLIIHKASFSQIIRVSMEGTKRWQSSYCKGLSFNWVSPMSVFHVINREQGWMKASNSHVVQMRRPRSLPDYEMCKMNWTWIIQTLVGFVGLLMTI